jgi:hypothetical protein
MKRSILQEFRSNFILKGLFTADGGIKNILLKRKNARELDACGNWTIVIDLVESQAG